MKVKVKEAQSQEVDWTKNPQLVTFRGAVVMTFTDQDGCGNDDFAGIAIIGFGELNIGDSSIYFSKKLWKPFYGEITLKND